MLITGEGLILDYVSYTETTASPAAVKLCSKCGQTDPAIRYFALLFGRDTEAVMIVLCSDYMCFVA
jgi:hypothetical protein